MWNSLTELIQLDQAIQASVSRVQVFFKHSTRCSISRVALSRFDREPAADIPADFHLLDLLQFRDLSHQLTERSGIIHESPQLLMIKNGKCVYHANHLDIEPSDVYATLRALEH